MLGGYYLGQSYLGISGGASRLDELIIHGSVHEITAENVKIIQYHILPVDNTGHEISSDNLTTYILYALLVENGIHGLATDNVRLIQLYTLLIDNTTHDTLSRHILKIFNWDEMNKFFGLYIKDFGEQGAIDSIEKPDTSIYILDKDKNGVFTTSEVDKGGVYIKNNNKQGLL